VSEQAVDVLIDVSDEWQFTVLFYLKTARRLLYVLLLPPESPINTL